MNKAFHYISDTFLSKRLDLPPLGHEESKSRAINVIRDFRCSFKLQAASYAAGFATPWHQTRCAQTVAACGLGKTLPLQGREESKSRTTNMIRDFR